MKRNRHTEEQIISILKANERVDSLRPTPGLMVYGVQNEHDGSMSEITPRGQAWQTGRVPSACSTRSSHPPGSTDT